MKRTCFLCGLLLVGLLGFAWGVGAAELFPAKDSNLRLFGTYLDQAEDQWGGGLGLDYFFSSYVGMGLSTHLENVTGTAVDNLSTELYLRLPIEKWHLAPYAVGSAGYQFGHAKWFETAGGGLEFRFSQKWGIFADYQRIFNDARGVDNVIRAGFRLK